MQRSLFAEGHDYLITVHQPQYTHPPGVLPLSPQAANLLNSVRLTMIITIDGPAGAGKSTIARLLARRLGFRFLDTGAMYRAIALAGIRQGIDWNHPEELAELARQVKLRVVQGRVLLNGEDVTDAVRSSEVTAATRFAADNPQVREHLAQLQRAEAQGADVVTEGRDQGTVVFPDAECKIFLTASSMERSRRRLADLQAQGELKSLEEVSAELTRRDQQDLHRPVGALRMAPDAVEICTDNLGIEEVVERVQAVVQDRRRTASRKP
jgi:cytidylate kinase